MNLRAPTSGLEAIPGHAEPRPKGCIFRLTPTFLLKFAVSGASGSAERVGQSVLAEQRASRAKSVKAGTREVPSGPRRLLCVLDRTGDRPRE